MWSQESHSVFSPDVYWEDIGSKLCGEEGALESKDVVGWGEPFTSLDLILINHRENASNCWVRKVLRDGVLEEKNVYLSTLPP